MTTPPVLTPAALALALKKATTDAWTRGVLAYKLDDTQRLIYDRLQAAKGRKFFLLCSRRLGKTYLLLNLAFEVARKKPGSRILFLAPSGKQASEIAADTASQILADCPDELRPEYRAQQKEFVFPAKKGAPQSIIRLKGVNAEHYDDIRGTAADLIILDECGTMDNLDAIVQSVCLPMTMSTGGRIIMATTPADSPGHPSTQIYLDLAEEGGAVKFTLLDAVRYPRELKAEYLREAKEPKENIEDILDGKKRPKTTTALREYFCEFVTDASKAVIPEMLEHRDRVVRKHTRPEVFDAYVSVDPGFADKTGILYAYYDFREGQLVIEAENLLKRASTNDITTAILETEYRLWGDQKPYLRVIDNDARLGADLFQRHGLIFHPAQKADMLKGLNLARSMIATGELVVDAACVNLIRQMEIATWNTKGNDFARTEDGHYDLVAALKYLVRSVNVHHNPGVSAPKRRAGFDGTHFRSPRGKKQRLTLFDETPAGKRLGKRR